MKGFVCQVCGHIEFTSAPDACPVCGSPKDKYKEEANAIIPAEKEGKEKHVPLIVVTDDCGLIPGVCRDIHVKVGSTPHPMEDAHWIHWIDVYINKVFTARYMLYPQSMLPAVGLHVKKEKTGTLTVVEHCNKHGSWMAEADI